MPFPADQFEADLRGVFRGSLFADAARRGAYSTDASPFQIQPLAVAIPLDEADLQTLLKYTYEQNIAVIPRGAGTGWAGESLGAGLIVDLSVHFRKIISIDSKTVTLQPGVVLGDLNRDLAEVGRRFAPNLVNERTVTLGGMLGTNASGSNSFAHGTTADFTNRLKVLWDSGEPGNLGRGQTLDEGIRTTEIRSQVGGLLAQNLSVIENAGPHRAGYRLRDLALGNDLDWPRLLVGSEGTLATFVEAELRTIPLPVSRSSLVLAFRSWNEALRAGLLLRGAAGIASADLFDQRGLSLARPALQARGHDWPEGAVAILIAEFESNENDAGAKAREAFEKIGESFAAAALLGPTSNLREWGEVQRVLEILVRTNYSASGSAQPISLFEDTAVPLDEVVRYASGLAELLRRHDFAALFHVHPLMGQIQVRPLVDWSRQADRAKLWLLADQVFQLAIALGGTIGSRHGLGLARTPWLAKQSPALVPVFAELKRIFDPKNLLNPGKIVGPDPSRPAWPLREPPEAPESVRIPLLSWSETERASALAKCNGCGDCRIRSTPTRMCPSFQAQGIGTAAPLAQASLLRQLLSAERDTVLTGEEAKELAGFCVNCKMCRSECPSQVDIPRLALEAKAQLHAANGLNREEWVLARLGGLVRFGGGFSTFANAMLGSRIARWFLEKTFGLSRKRTLPRLARRPFEQTAKRLGLTQRGAKVPSTGPQSAIRVAYFVDVFANHADTLIAEATCAVLRHNGIEVFVPTRQRGTGVAALAQGDLDKARIAAARNVRAFADLIREGYIVVCSEPTAAITIVQDYPDLLPEADTLLLANQTQELTAFLGGLLDAGWLRTDFLHRIEMTLGHHVPCHIKARGVPPAGPKLLRTIPGITVVEIDRSCSGMAGAQGFRADAYESSLRIGKPMLDELNKPEIQLGSTECSLCRLQMQEGSGKRALHPVQYLAYAYGLMPKLARRLNKPLRKRLSD